MRFLSVKEAAEELEVSAPRVYQLITQGRLKATKMGKEYVIRVEDLEPLRGRSKKGGRPRKRRRKRRGGRKHGNG